MGWKDIKAKYERQGGNSQSTEDMVARRILRALSLTNGEALRKAELEYGTAEMRGDDTTLLERAESLAMQMCRTAFRPPVVSEVKRLSDAEAMLNELADAGESYRPLVYRIGDEDVRVMLWLGTAQCVDFSSMPVPCTVRLTRHGWFVLDCDAGTYFDRILGKERTGGQ